MQKAQMRTFICLPYLSLLQHQKSEQYYKHGLISNLKPFGGKYPPVFSDGGQGGYLWEQLDPYLLQMKTYFIVVGNKFQKV